MNQYFAKLDNVVISKTIIDFNAGKHAPEKQSLKFMPRTSNSQTFAHLLYAKGMTPLALAKQSKNQEIIEMLTDAGAK
jgi:hypothetical protein